MFHVKHIHSSIDYIRVTEPPYSAVRLEDLQLVASSASLKTSDGEVPFPVRQKRMQYHGQSWAGVFVGEHEQGLMLEASGYTAHHVALMLAERGNPASIPRLDAQVTVWFDRDHEDLARILADGAVRFADEDTRRARPRLIERFGAGDTLYAGTRGGNGSSLVRLYDKYRESNDDVYRNSWRFEAELTNRRAMPVWRELAPHFRERHIAAIVRAECERRGVMMPPLASADLFPVAALPKPKTTDESRLRWLETAVAPAIAGLMGRGYNAGHIRALLGLE